MHSSSTLSVPWDMEAEQQPTSFVHRVSGLFGRQNTASRYRDSDRNTATYEVPLFLSPSRYEPPETANGARDAPLRRSRTSTLSVIDAATSAARRIPALSLPSSSRYSSPTQSPQLAAAPGLPTDEPMQFSSHKDTESGLSISHKSKCTTVRQRRRRKTSTKRRIQSLKQLSAAFGITLLLGLITYLVLAMTGVASGTMFHVITILMLLSLTGVFLHFSIRLIMLLRRRQKKRSGGSQRGWTGQHDNHNLPDAQKWTDIEDAMIDSVSTEKPIRIIMADEDKVAAPPPIYGNYRGSKRMNPELVHWRHVPPSPLTPTYAEAMKDVQREVGYRPPSYLISESGATQIVESQRRDVDNALHNVHPLERERFSAWNGRPF